MRAAIALCCAVLVACGPTSSNNLEGGENWGGGDPGSGSSSGGGGSGGSGGGSGGGNMGGGGGNPTQEPQLAQNLVLSEIAIFQGVKIDVMTGGMPATRKAPIVSNRDALVRAYVTPGNGWSPKEVTARLVLDGVAMDSKLTPSVASTDADMGTTFNFTVPGAKLLTTTTIRVALLDAATMGPPVSSTPSTARWPADGTATALGAKSSGASVKVVLVPIRYGADGSNRLPDTSNTQVTTYTQTMFGIYPASKVDVTVRQQAVGISFSVLADGTGWNQLLSTLLSVRAQDGAANDVYYYGAFSPAASMQTYCGGGCVAGLSPIVQSVGDAANRGSIGLGFTGQVSADTMAHEVGHAHGRPHAPCGGASGTDPNFPYAQAGIGSWGWNLSSQKLIAPTSAKDMMSYCNPSWISDYNYALIFDRIKAVNGAYIQQGPPVTYRFAALEPNGAIVFTGNATLTIPPSGTKIAIHYPSTGAHDSAWFYPSDHVAGGTLLVPVGPNDLVIDSMLPQTVEPSIHGDHIGL